MKRICFRLAIARPEVGFDYYGSWNAYDPSPVLEDARRELQKSPHSLLRIQCSDARGREVDLGWNAEWLKLLETQYQKGFRQSDWNRQVAAILMSDVEKTHLGNVLT